jgi:hypothetical protein
LQYSCGARFLRAPALDAFRGGALRTLAAGFLSGFLFDNPAMRRMGLSLSRHGEGAIWNKRRTNVNDELWLIQP